MSFIAVATGVGALGSIAGGIMGSNAANSAAEQQAAAAKYSADLQKQIYDQQRLDNTPWRDAGATALSKMADPYFQKSFSGADFQQDPGYQFRMDQGNQAMQRSAAARGGLMSGGFAKGLDRYNQDYASNEYQNAYNRFNNDQSSRFGRLSSVAGMGQNANSQLGAAGQNYANQVGQTAMGAANAQGAAGIASAGAWGGALSGVANAGMGYAAMKNQNNWMNQFKQNQNAGGGGLSSLGSFGGESGFDSSSFA
jgi:hypothetical protein